MQGYNARDFGMGSVLSQETEEAPRGKMPVWLIFPAFHPPQEQAGDP